MITAEVTVSLPGLRMAQPNPTRSLLLDLGTKTHDRRNVLGMNLTVAEADEVEPGPQVRTATAMFWDDAAAALIRAGQEWPIWYGELVGVLQVLKVYED
jgi:hypothetical protein